MPEPTDQELLERAKRNRAYHKRYNRVRWRAMVALAKLYPEDFDRLIGEMMFREDNEED
jgi:hypothetical protein